MTVKERIEAIDALSRVLHVVETPRQTSSLARNLYEKTIKKIDSLVEGL